MRIWTATLFAFLLSNIAFSQKKYTLHATIESDTSYDFSVYADTTYINSEIDGLLLEIANTETQIRAALIDTALGIRDDFPVDTDDQLLSISGDTLYIQDGNNVDLADYLDSKWSTESSYIQHSGDVDVGGTLSINEGIGDQLFIGEDPTTIGAIIETDGVLTLSADGDVYGITNRNGSKISLQVDGDEVMNIDAFGSVLLPTYIGGTFDDVDVSSLLGINSSGRIRSIPTYDLTDDQDLTLSGDSLLITDGVGVDMSTYLDDTDDQDLTLSGDSLLISDGIGVDLSALSSTDTHIGSTNLTLSGNRTLTMGGNWFNLTGGGCNDGWHYDIRIWGG